MIRVCLTCSKDFHTIPYEVSVGKGKFCSRTCYSESKRGSVRPQWVKDKISKNHANLGKHLSEETKGRISKAFWNRGGQSKEWKEQVLGPNAPWWKGDNASYTAIHKLARKMYKGTKCQFCNADNRKLHIANKSGKYRRLDADDWLTLCVPCHKSFDLSKKSQNR